MKEYREGFPTFVVVSILGLAGYFAGGWWLWHLDQGKSPVLTEGVEKDGQRLSRIAEERILPHSWSRWVEATGNGLWTEMQPREAGRISKAQFRFEDGTIQDVGGQDTTDKRIVAARVWNGASIVIEATFFTWVRARFSEGDIEKGERLEKVSTVSLQSGEWSEWVVQPEGTSELIMQMDSYAEEVVKCSLRLDDGTVRVVPAAERWTGQRIHGVRLHNEGANPVTATVLAWRPLEQPATARSSSPAPPSSQSASDEAPVLSTDDVPLPDTAERPPGTGWRPRRLLTVVLRQWGTSPWVDRPTGCWGVIPVCSDPARFMGQFYLADDQYAQTYNPKYHLKQEAARARAENAGYGGSVRVTFYTWCK